MCLLVSGMVVGVAVLSGHACAEQAAYPDKAVRLVVPFAAGGGLDSVARIVAQPLAATLGQQIVIDNRGGAGGLIGIDIVAHSTADGYTLLVSHTGLAMMPALHRKLSFDPARDFAGIIVLASGVYVLVVNPALPVKSTEQLIAHAKANPGKLGFASAGAGSTIHLAGELLKRSAGIDVYHVPYKGAAPAITDVVAGQVAMMFGTVTNTLPLAKTGRLRALAVTSAKRSALAPDLPTVAEAGLPDFEVVGWYGLAAPARTPRAIIAKLNADTNRVLETPEVVERLRGQGLEAVGGTPERATDTIRADVVRLTKVIQEAGIKAE